MDLAAACALYAAGAILFGRFEEHKPRWRRLLKFALVVAAFAGLLVAVGRAWAYAALAAPLLGAAWLHLVWLPRHGINGWTGEPRERYLDLIRSRKH